MKISAIPLGNVQLHCPSPLYNVDFGADHNVDYTLTSWDYGSIMGPKKGTVGYTPPMGFVYRKDGNTYRVGFYDPDKRWHEDSAFKFSGIFSDAKARDKAISRVLQLNGGK